MRHGLGALLALALAACASTAPPPRPKPKPRALLENFVIYHPSKGGDWSHDASIRDVEIAVDEGVTTFSWYRPAKPGGWTILYLHGNAGNIAGRRKLFDHFGDRGVFLLDYRGYGKSTGAPYEDCLYEDAHCAFDWLVASGVDPARIVLYGESLGTAVATEIARRVEAGGLVLQSPFTNLPDMAATSFPELARTVVQQKYDSLAKIADVGEPLLIIHSPVDEMVPFEQARRLFAAAREPKSFCELKSAGHNTTWSERETVQKALADFFATLK